VRAAWAAALGAAVASRVANAWLQPGPSGFDAWGHIAYVFFIDLYRAIPYADQGWSYFHPPLHYVLGWVLAQSGSADVLVRGLSLLGSAASLGTALLAAGVVRRCLPERPYLPVLAFTAVAFLPVQVYSSPMSGNEQTATFLGSAAVAVFLANSLRSRPSLALDAASGALVGVALLTKFSALIPLLAIAATLALQLARGALGRREAAARFAVITGIGLLLPAPYYARNIAEFGKPFVLSRDYPLVAGVESGQPPGERSWIDFVQLPPAILSQRNWRDDHLLHSVWGTAYLRTWVENPRGLALRRALALAGLVPTALFVFGFGRALGRVRRSPRSAAEPTMVLLAAGGFAAFALFALRVPIFSALKATYLLSVSLPYGFFVALAFAEPPPRAAGAVRAVGGLALTVAVGLAVVAFTPGLGTRLRPENALMAAAHAHFGDLDTARRIYREELERALETAGDPKRSRPGWVVAVREALAAVEIAAGDSMRGMDLYAESSLLPRKSSSQLSSATAPQRLSRIAVAAALAGEPQRGRYLLDTALANGPITEPLANRGALRAVTGNLAGAVNDLQRALELAPELAPALHNLAWVRERLGAREQARRLRQQAERAAWITPRGFPYGVGDGFHLNEPRLLLLIEGNELALYHPPRARERR
jgi:hypothetical protein